MQENEFQEVYDFTIKLLQRAHKDNGAFQQYKRRYSKNKGMFSYSSFEKDFQEFAVHTIWGVITEAKNFKNIGVGDAAAVDETNNRASASLVMLETYLKIKDFCEKNGYSSFIEKVRKAIRVEVGYLTGLSNIVRVNDEMIGKANEIDEALSKDSLDYRFGSLRGFIKRISNDTRGKI